MTKNQITFMGDLHLKKHTWSSKPDIKDDTYHALDQVVNHCLKAKTPLVLMGDVFDSNTPSSEDVVRCQSALSRLVNSDIGIYWIDGNHDISHTSWAEVMPGVQPLHGHTYNIAGIEVRGYDYSSTEFLENEFKDLAPSVEILVCHQMLDALFSFHSNLRADSVPSTVKLCMLGDLHQTVTTTSPTGVEFWYSGSGAMMSISEPVDKFFLTVSRGNNGLLSVEKNPLQTRRYHKIPVRNEKGLQDLIRNLNSGTYRTPATAPLRMYPGLEVPILHVYVNPEVEAIKSRIQQVGEFKDHSYHLWLSVLPKDQDAPKGPDLSDVPEVDTVNLYERGILDKYLDPEDDDKARELAKALLTSPDPKEVFRSAKKALGIKED